MKISIFNRENVIFLILLNVLSKIFLNTFYIWREIFFFYYNYCDGNISGNDDCVESKLIPICFVVWRNIKGLFSNKSTEAQIKNFNSLNELFELFCYLSPPYPILLTGLVFFWWGGGGGAGIVTPPPVISNGPSLIKSGGQRSVFSFVFAYFQSCLVNRFDRNKGV